MTEIRRPAGDQDTVRAGRPRRVEPDRPDALPGDPGHREHLVEGVHERGNGFVRSFAHQAGQLGHLRDEERALGSEHRPVVRRATVVDANGHPVTRCRHEPSSPKKTWPPVRGGDRWPGANEGFRLLLEAYGHLPWSPTARLEKSPRAALSVLKANIRDAQAAGKAGIRHPLCRAPPGTGTLIDTAPFLVAWCWR